MLVTIAAAASPLDRASDDLSAPRTADLPKRTRSWFRPAGGVADCPLDAPVILLKMARAGSSDIVQNLGKALPACRWDAELLHETNEFLSAGDYNKCNDAALAEEQRLFREAMGERSIISHNPVSTAGGCFSFAVERTGDGAMGGLPRLEELLEEHMPRRGVTVAWIRHNALRAAVSDHWMAVSGTVHSDGGTRSSTHYPKWGAPVRDIVLATVRWQCNTRLLLETVGAACWKWPLGSATARQPGRLGGIHLMPRVAHTRQSHPVRHEWPWCHRERMPTLVRVGHSGGAERQLEASRVVRGVRQRPRGHARASPGRVAVQGRTAAGCERARTLSQSFGTIASGGWAWDGAGWVGWGLPLLLACRGLACCTNAVAVLVTTPWPRTPF